MADSTAARRADVADRLTAAARLVTEQGWEGVAEGVLSGAAERLAQLEWDEFTTRFKDASDRLDLALLLMDRRHATAAALCVLDDLSADSFDPLGFSESDEERIGRIEYLRRWEAGE